MTPSRPANVAADGSPSLERTFRVPKAAELVAHHLRRLIVTGELKEGDNLPSENALIEEFGVSRPTLREAFRILETESLISVKRGARGGAQVHVPSSDMAARYVGLVLEYRQTTLADVLEARAIVEPPCAGRLAVQRSAADLKRLRKAVDDADAVIDDPGLGIRRQQEFHALVVELGGNETIRLMVSMLRQIIDTATIAKIERDAGTPGERTAQHLGHRSHRRLVEHIANRDGAAAERLWRKHILETTAFLTEGTTSATVVQLPM